MGGLRILVVDDYEPWRASVASMLLTQSDLRIIGEAKDGLEAVQIAQQLQPDLILLDIGMPRLNGIEAARRIRDVSPNSRILFISENRSRDIAEEALRTGASGYLVKGTAGSELLPALEAVLSGKRFVSASLSGPALNDFNHRHTAVSNGRVSSKTLPTKVQTPYHHEVGFYFDDRLLLENVTQFVGGALQAKDAVIVIATESHRNTLLSKLESRNLDIGTAIKQRRYIEVDVAEAVSSCLVHGMLDPVRYIEIFGSLIQTATTATVKEHPHVTIFGEGAPLLWTQGNAVAAIQAEKLCNELANSHDIDVLCGYSRRSSRGEMDPDFFEQICAEHSGVYSW